MKIPRLIQSFAPPPRKPLAVRDALPLAVFLTLFIGGCVFVEWRGILRFSNPRSFFLLLLTPWFWWMSLGGFSGLGGGRAVVALLTRLSLAGAFIMLLAEPRAVRKSDTLSVVYALDLSDSMGGKISDASLGYITKTASAKPQKDEAGLVVFGRDAAVELPPRKTFPFEAINSRISRDGTNIEKGLALAAAMLPETNQGRIVLVSDGNETEGNAAGVLEDLKSRGIAVDVLPVQFDYKKEVWLERLDLPRVVKTGETYEASVVLSSLQKGAGKLALRENGKTIFEKNVEFDAGKNRFTLPLYLREPGYYEYAATIELPPGEDGRPENNIAINDLFLKGEGKVLLVTDFKGDARDWQTLADAMKQSRRVVEVMLAYEFPHDALTLLPYDCIIFANAPADAFNAAQLQAVRDAVYNQGIGFLMLGGPNSYGPGGYHRSAIEEALPVTMDISQKKVLPKGALALILHTCEFAEGNTWAKRIAKEAVRVLGAQDEVGLIDYEDAGDQWVFPLSPAGRYEDLALLINKAEPSDMPSFATSMKMGLDALRASDAATKHMIIISDGDPSPPTPALIQDFVDAKISISTVAINPHGGQDISIMQTMSAATGGRYYFPQDPSQLPSIFVKEAKTLKRSMLQNKTFTPDISFPSPILKGIDALPPLHGYVLTTPKARATTILKGPETEEINPVLATWRFGLGTTAAFTSDLSPNWAAEWVGWEKYQAFVKQLLTDISRTEQKSDLRVQTFSEGGKGVILVEDFHAKETFLEMEARVTGPQQRSETVRLAQVGPRRYQAQFPLWGKGHYQVVTVGAGAGRSEQAVNGFAVPYSPEYLHFRSNPMLLSQIAGKTGGRVLTGRETDLFQTARKPRESSRPVFDWFLMALAMLLPLDVGVRRIQLDWQIIRAWFRRKEQASGATLDALLQRKQEVTTTLQSHREDRLSPVSSRTISIAPKTEAQPKPAEEKSPEQSGQELSTTERLLARKRKREQKDE